MNAKCISQSDFELADQLAKAALELVVDVKMGDGFNEAAYAETEKLLIECASSWKELEVVPKQAAEMFVTLQFHLHGEAQHYPEEEANRIYSAVYRFTDLIIDCVALPEELRRDR